MPEYATSADGTRIAWYDFGGDGPELLLGHATGFCAHIWAPVLETLRDHFHCYAYDMRGHGQSSRPAAGRDSWDWHRYADDVFAVLDATELQQPYSVGHSCGSFTALLVEEREPATFRAHVGFEPPTFVNDPPLGPDESRELVLRTRARRTSFASRDEALENFSKRGPFTALDERALAAYVDYGFAAQPDGSLALRCHPDDEAEVYVMATAHDGYLNLSRVKCPTTIIRGARSKAFTEETLRSVANRVQSGTYLEVDGTGHFGAVEKPAEFCEIVLRAFSSDK